MKFSSAAAALVAYASTSASLTSALRARQLGNGPDKNRGNGPDKAVFIVTLNKDKTTGPGNKCKNLAKAHGGAVGHVYQKVMNGCSIEMPLNAIEALKKNPSVKAVEKDKEVKKSQAPVSWGLDRVDQCNLPIDQSFTQVDATGVRVYILDTGIDKEHSKLNGYIYPNNGCHFTSITPEFGWSTEEGAFNDGDGHGTHVAGTTCGDDYGVATNCDLCAVKVLSNSGYGSGAGVIAGIDHAVQDCESYDGRCVINMSLGGGFSQAENDAIRAAVDSNVSVVVAAGNDDANACNFSPASEPKAITVGSTGSNDLRSSFSNWGTCVDVYAPGSDILSSLPGESEAAWYGTSMASPHVAGIVAGMRNDNPSLSANQINDKIAAEAYPIGLDGAPTNLEMKLANTIGTCNGPTPPPTPTPPPPPCTIEGGVGKEIAVNVITDDYPEETTWFVKASAGGDEIMSGGPYANTRTEYSDTQCVTPGSYVFTINDAWGDGICCSYGSGSFTISYDGVEVTESGEGEFGYSINVPFGTSGPTPPPTPAPTPPPTPAPTPQPTSSPTHSQAWEEGYAAGYAAGAASVTGAE